MDRNRISDTDSFWDQLGENQQSEVKTDMPVISVEREREKEIEKEKRKNRNNRNNRRNREQSMAAKKNDGSVTMSRNTVIAIVTAAVVCIGSFLGIFWKLSADKQEILSYIETELADIRATNDAAIAEMKDTLDRMETNFDEIVSLLEETGAAIGSSSQESRAAISERIEKLDKQLQSLQKSLAILQEDANGRKK